MRLIKIYLLLVCCLVNIHANDFEEFQKEINQNNYTKAFDIYSRHINGEETTQYQSYVFNRTVMLVKNNPSIAEELISNFLEIEFNNPTGRFLLSQIYYVQNNYLKSLEILFQMQSTYLEEELGREVDKSIEAIQNIYLTSFKEIDTLQYALDPFFAYDDEYFVIKWQNTMLNLFEKALETENYNYLLELYPKITKYNSDEKTNKKIEHFYKRVVNNYLINIEEKKLMEEIPKIKYFLQIYGYEIQLNKLLLIEKKLERESELKNIFNKKIPLLKDGNKLYVNAFVGGAQVKFLLDTGASSTMLDSDTIGNINYRVIDPNQIISTASGQTSASRVIVDSLQVDDIKVSNFEVIVSKNNVFTEFDGLLGMDFLGQFKFSIDKENGYLYLN